jgi:hypothetical protein
MHHLLLPVQGSLTNPRRNFYQMRLDRIRNAEIARRNKERLKSPTAFPAVPKGDP